MSRSKLRTQVARMKILAANLSKCKKVTRFDRGKEKEAWTLAHAFTDLEESFNIFVKEQLPKLMKKSLSQSEIENVLFDIGSEFQHILYHIKDPKYYRGSIEDYWETI